MIHHASEIPSHVRSKAEGGNVEGRKLSVVACEAAQKHFQAPRTASSKQLTLEEGSVPVITPAMFRALILPSTVAPAAQLLVPE